LNLVLWSELSREEKFSFGVQEEIVRDPVVFAERLLGWTPHECQRLVMCDGHKYRVISAGRRFGKSEMMAVLLLHLAATKPGSIQYVVSLTLDQAAIIFEVCVNLLEGSVLKGLVGDVKRTPFPVITLKNGSSIHARSVSNDGHYLRGKRAHRVVCDEAAFIKDKLIEQVVRPMLMDFDGELFLISTPRGRNWFYDEWLKGKCVEGDRNFNANYASFQFSSYDNPFLKRSVIDENRKLMYDEQFRCEIMAEFIDDFGFVFKWSVLDKCSEEYDCSPVPVAGRSYVMGVDVAKDVDYTVIVVLDVTDGNEVRVAWVERFNQKDYDYVNGRILELGRLFCPLRIVVDASSAGSPVVDRLVNDLPQIEGFTFANTLQNPKKVLLLQNLRLGLEQRRLRLPLKETVLCEELHYFSYKITDSGIMTMSAPSGKHDDCVIALALAWSFCVVPLAELTVVGVEANPSRGSSRGGVPVLVGDALSLDSGVPDLGSPESFYSYR
jgi:phage FluMu gp28-like protein